MQSTVYTAQGFGVQGEVYSDSPHRVKSYILTSASNTVGYAYTITAEGNAQVGGTGDFGGILINPKSYALVGSSLTPSLVLAQHTQGELMTMGEVIVYIDNAATVGDDVWFDVETGALSAGTATDGNVQIGGAKVVRFSNAAAGLAVIELGGTITLES